MPIKTGIVLQTSVNSYAGTVSMRTWTDQHRLSKFPHLLGRPFWTYVEKAADGINLPMPSMPFVPGGRDPDGNAYLWEAPFYPDQKYADFSRSPYGQFQWAYQRMESDDQTETDTFYMASARLAARKGWEMPEPGKPLPYAIAIAIGDLPRSPLIARALRAGNPWLIGESQDPDDDFLPGLVRQLQRASMWDAPMTKAVDVVNMAPKNLDALIAEAVQKALAAQQAGQVPGAPVTPKKPGKNAEYLAFAAEQRALNKNPDEISALWKDHKAMAGAA